MQLKINGETVDYTLEKESVLSQVVKAVEDWLGGSGYLITGIREGGRDLLASPPADWGGTPIDSVAELDFRVSHAEDVRVELWVTVRALLGMVIRELDSPEAGSDALLATLPEALDSLQKNPPQPSTAGTAGRLGAALRELGTGDARAWPPERLREVKDMASRLRDELGSRIAEASRPRETLARHLAELASVRATIADVSVLLASGKDRQAMEAVVTFSDLMQRLLGILPFLPPDQERQKLFGELNGVLRDLLAAFDARDLVLIGDLFEYEVAPRVDRLVPLLQRCL